MSGRLPPRLDRDTAPESVTCAFCDSEDTALLSPFGGALSVAQFWCYNCRTGFEHMKWRVRSQEESAPGDDRER